MTTPGGKWVLWWAFVAAATWLLVGTLVWVVVGA